MECALNTAKSDIEIANMNETFLNVSDEFHSQMEKDQSQFIEFITEGVLLIIISIFGFVGNALSIYVLLRPTVKGIFSNILMGLASFDALFLICAIVTFGLPTVSVWYKKNIFHTIMPVSYGLTHTARVGSVMATLSVTLERFFAIVFPFKDVEVVKRWLLPCAVTFTVTYNIPKFFELTTEFDPYTNETQAVGTDMRRNQAYSRFYVFWSKVIVTDLIPYFTILTLNSFIVTKIVKSIRFRARILQARNMQAEEVSEDQLRALEKQRQEHKLGILLVAISILFILCQSFKMIPDLYEIMYCESIANCESTPFVTFCVNLSHLLVCFNSSANFVIYLLGGEKFRRAWCQTYLCRKADSSHTRHQTFRMNSMTTMTTNNSVSRKVSNKTVTSLASSFNGNHVNSSRAKNCSTHLETPLLSSGEPTPSRNFV